MTGTHVGSIVRRHALLGAPFTTPRFSGVSRRIVPGPVWDSLGTFCIETPERVVALTYDDGPHPEHTPRILDVLAAHGARATFFVLDRPALANPGIVARIVAEGHEVALHGPDHTSLLTLSTAEAAERIRGSRSRVEELSGIPVSLYRPPYGQHTTAQARAITRLGLEVAIWSGEAGDWLHDDEEAIAERALRTARPGGVLLLHDDRADLDRLQPGERAPQFDRALVLRHVLQGLDAEGFASVTMSDLLRRGPRVRTIARERTRL